jgi:hypothetical protein
MPLGAKTAIALVVQCKMDDRYDHVPLAVYHPVILMTLSRIQMYPSHRRALAVTCPDLELQSLERPGAEYHFPASSYGEKKPCLSLFSSESQKETFFSKFKTEIHKYQCSYILQCSIQAQVKLQFGEPKRSIIQTLSTYPFSCIWKSWNTKKTPYKEAEHAQ